MTSVSGSTYPKFFGRQTQPQHGLSAATEGYWKMLMAKKITPIGSGWKGYDKVPSMATLSKRPARASTRGSRANTEAENEENRRRAITLGGYIRGLREDLELRQVDVAAEVGVSAAMLSQWERGEAKIVEFNVPALAKALEVPAKELAMEVLKSQHPWYYACLFSNKT